MAYKLLKILLGVMNLVPLAFALMEFFVMLPIIKRVQVQTRGDFGQALLHDQEFMNWNDIFGPLSIVLFGLIVLYIVLALRNKRMTLGIRFVWALGILFVSAAMIPSYYFLFIARKAPSTPKFV